MGTTWVWWVHEWILGGRMLELGLCCVLSQKQTNKYSSISLGLILGSQPQWLWLYTMETGIFCRIFSKCLFPSKAVDVYGTICYSYIQQAFWHGNLFLLKPNSLVARDTLHFVSDVCFSISVHYNEPQFYSVTLYLFKDIKWRGHKVNGLKC